MVSLRRLIVVTSACVALVGNSMHAAAAYAPGPLGTLQTELTTMSHAAPGHVGILVQDLNTGLSTGINAGANMPAASTIKIPVMVEVFRQMSLGDFDLNRKVALQGSDRDDGWGDLVAARRGSSYTVSKLLSLMITESDNTATNMLIRLVGRAHINTTMAHLGLAQTTVGDYIRSEGDIRSLRSSPGDMVKLLVAMAHDRLVDSWSSRAMIQILTGQHHNGLLPEPLPRGIPIAHKTGTLHDTLNDVGIVYLDSEPYVIAVMTTQLPTLDAGRAFIRGVSRVAYSSLARFARWRAANTPPSLEPLQQPVAPDVRMWSTPGQEQALPAPQPTATPDVPAALPVAPGVPG